MIKRKDVGCPRICKRNLRKGRFTSFRTPGGRAIRSLLVYATRGGGREVINPNSLGGQSVEDKLRKWF